MEGGITHELADEIQAFMVRNVSGRFSPKRLPVEILPGVSHVFYGTKNEDQNLRAKGRSLLLLV